ncbi:hypothetical protein M513_01122 [Trichuris suis]|uniref:Uncharacterized protein n=1 Tax=Trichuris suis TaxID=68888 RepID=A0A085MKZ3_9BILA|nr:hypothetical protein M513_01122 [Trichuris suis]
MHCHLKSDDAFFQTFSNSHLLVQQRMRRLLRNSLLRRWAYVATRNAGLEETMRRSKTRRAGWQSVRPLRWHRKRTWSGTLKKNNLLPLLPSRTDRRTDERAKGNRCNVVNANRWSFD